MYCLILDLVGVSTSIGTSFEALFGCPLPSTTPPPTTTTTTTPPTTSTTIPTTTTSTPSTSTTTTISTTKSTRRPNRRPTTPSPSTTLKNYGNLIDQMGNSITVYNSQYRLDVPPIVASSVTTNIRSVFAALFLCLVFVSCFCLGPVATDMVSATSSYEWNNIKCGVKPKTNNKTSK